MALILLFWLLVWQVAAMFLHNEVLLPGPFLVVKDFIGSIGTKIFWARCLRSLLRILTGFFVGGMVGYGLSLLFEENAILRAFLRPVILLLKAVPVACVAVLLLILWNSKWLVFFVVLSVVIPQILSVMEAGLESVPDEMREMGAVYGFTYGERLRYIKRPYYAEGLRKGLVLSLETSFKAGISAEIIGIPLKSMGEGIYLSKIYFDTAGVLTMVLMILILTTLCKGILIVVLNNLDHNAYQKKYVKKQGKKHSQVGYLSLQGIGKKYEDQTVLSNVTVRLEDGKKYWVSGPSGLGKTTLLKIIGGLLAVDEGLCQEETSVSILFQEDRLVMQADALTNVLLGMRKRDEAVALSLLEEVGIAKEEATKKAVQAFSGGMRRKVALVRALLTEGELLLLDEPFASVDEESMKRMLLVIEKNITKKTCVIVSHLPLAEWDRLPCFSDVL